MRFETFKPRQCALQINSAGTCNSVAGCNSIAKWNGGTWSALGAGMMSGDVYTVAISGSDVYVGGVFPIGPNVYTYIAKWDGAPWSALGTGMSGGIVNAIAVSDVYAGGGFTSAGTCNSAAGCNHIARWGNAPTAVTLSSFHAAAPLFDLGAWLKEFLGR